MPYLSCGAVFPIVEELIVMQEQENLKQAAVKTTQCVLSARPQTIVLLTKEVTGVEDAVRVDIRPRMKSSLEPFGRPELLLSFETDNLLMRSILHQADRLGIPLAKQSEETVPVEELLDARFCIPFFFLQQAGFKGQVVHIRAQGLSYEEMYTFGKTVQLAADNAKKRTTALIAADFFTRRAKMPAAGDFIKSILPAIEKADAKALLGIDRQAVQRGGEGDFPLLFFLLGALGKQAKLEYLYEDLFEQGVLSAAFYPK